MWNKVAKYLSILTPSRTTDTVVEIQGNTIETSNYTEALRITLTEKLSDVAIRLPYKFAMEVFKRAHSVGASNLKFTLKGNVAVIRYGRYTVKHPVEITSPDISLIIPKEKEKIYDVDIQLLERAIKYSLAISPSEGDYSGAYIDKDGWWVTDGSCMYHSSIIVSDRLIKIPYSGLKAMSKLLNVKDVTDVSIYIPKEDDSMVGIETKDSNDIQVVFWTPQTAMEPPLFIEVYQQALNDVTTQYISWESWDKIYHILSESQHIVFVPQEEDTRIIGLDDLWGSKITYTDVEPLNFEEPVAFSSKILKIFKELPHQLGIKNSESPLVMILSPTQTFIMMPCKISDLEEFIEATRR